MHQEKRLVTPDGSRVKGLIFSVSSMRSLKGKYFQIAFKCKHKPDTISVVVLEGPAFS